MATLISLVIKLYQRIGPLFLPRSCRYYPTCSSYALEAFKKYGFRKGCSKSFLRILRCSPFFSGGYDPVD